MTITLGQCSEHIRQSLNGPPAAALGSRNIIDHAGIWLTTSAMWRWLERGTYHLDKRGPLTGTGATWTEATRTLQLAGAFATYVFLEGDEIEITAGINTTLGFFKVQSRTDANNIVLASSPGATASAIAFNANLGGIALPPDFAEVIAMHPKIGTIAEIRPIGREELLRLRTLSAVTVSPFHVFAVFYGPSLLTTNGAPVPRLEIYPYPVANETGAFLLFYRQKWVTPLLDAERMPVPDFMEPLLLAAIRAVARGWEEEDEAQIQVRLAALKQSPFFVDAMKYDGAIQPSIGMIEGGAAARYWGTNFRWHRTDVLVNVP